MIQDGFGNITIGPLFTQFMAYTTRFTGGVNVTVCCVALGAEAIHKPGSLQNSSAVQTQNVVA